MILILTASIMHWSLKKPEDHYHHHREATPATPMESENEADVADEVSNLAVNDDGDASENPSTP